MNNCWILSFGKINTDGLYISQFDTDTRWQIISFDQRFDTQLVLSV